MAPSLQSVTNCSTTPPIAGSASSSPSPALRNQQRQIASMSRAVVLALLLSASAPAAAGRAAFATTCTECSAPACHVPQAVRTRSGTGLPLWAPTDAPSSTSLRMSSTLPTTEQTQTTASTEELEGETVGKKDGMRSSFAASLSSSFTAVADSHRIPRKKVVKKTTMVPSLRTIAHASPTLSSSPLDTVGKTGIRTISSKSSFLDFLDTQESSGDGALPPLCVVKFHAPYCKVCQRINLKYKQLAGAYTRDLGDSVIRFGDVDVVDNKQMCKLLDVPKTPFVQIYRNRECIASFGTGPAYNFPVVVGDTLSHFLNFSTESDWNRYRSEFRSNIDEALDALKQIEDLAKVENDTNDNMASSDKDVKVHDKSNRRAADGTILSP